MRMNNDGVTEHENKRSIRHVLPKEIAHIHYRRSPEYRFDGHIRDFTLGHGRVNRKSDAMPQYYQFETCSAFDSKRNCRTFSFICRRMCSRYYQDIWKRKAHWHNLIEQAMHQRRHIHQTNRESTKYISNISQSF
jgi:hypothetical protein